LDYVLFTPILVDKPTYLFGACVVAMVGNQ